MARWVFHLPGCRSLKMKRSIVGSLKGRIQSQFKVSVAETDFQDMWQRAELSVAFVTSDRQLAESILSKLENFVTSDPRALVVDRDTVFY